MKQNKGILIFNRGNPALSLVSALLQAEDYTVIETSLPLEAIHILQKNDIDVILANQILEGMDGHEFKELAEKIRPGVNIFLMPATPREKESQPMSDCTINLKELVQFIQNYIRTENRLLTESSSFKDFFFSFTDRLLQVFEVNDRYFFNNDHLVATLSKKIAIKMGLEEKLIEAIQISALLRDIGKVGIQHQIVDEKGKLEKDEFTVIKSHPLNTVQILKQVNFPWNVESIITHHHEHYDGNGYPEGLKGRQVPLGSRIITIVDSYVAMTTDRPYRKALRREEAVQEIVKKAGSQFDPEVVEVFLSVIQEELQVIDKEYILVLDRDKALSALIKLNISSEEFEVISTAGATEALQYLRERRPYVIIADLETLGIDKFYLYNAVRQDNSTNTIPFIIIAPNKDYPSQLTGLFVDVIVKPFNIDDLSSKIKTISKEEHPRPQPAKPAEEELSGVTGNLEDLSLPDIIQVLNMGLKTAKVILIRDKEKGTIYIKSGKIVSVHLDKLSGQEAFFRLMEWEKGAFRIFHGQTTDETNVTMDTMNLLLEASKVLDEKMLKK